jgi:SAM-dependent methyltransferase
VPDNVMLPDAVLNKIESGSRIDIELGCGNRKRHGDAIGIDLLYYDGVDIVGDIHTTLTRFPDQTVENVYAYHCFEHLKQLDAIMDQLSRVVKPKGRLYVEVPHFSNPYYYSDYTHRQPFGLYTFSYLAKESLFRLRCPTYQHDISFELQRVKLVFKSPRPFYGRYGIKKFFQLLFNLNRYTMEFYEENLCWMVPCYEICYDLRRL